MNLTDFALLILSIGLALLAFVLFLVSAQVQRHRWMYVLTGAVILISALGIAYLAVVTLPQQAAARHNCEIAGGNYDTDLGQCIRLDGLGY